MNYRSDINFASECDREDPLALFRSHFAFPKSDKEVLYFCGNSLGLMPLNSGEYVTESLTDWADLAVEGHFKAKHSWLYYHQYLRDETARIVGADPVQIVLMNTLSVNIHLMLVSFYRPEGKRTKIIMEGGSFPTDRYAMASQLHWHGRKIEDHLIELIPRPGEFTLRNEDILQAISEAGDELALVFIGGVQYYTGQLFDMKAITEAAHRVGAIAGFDLAHAAGNVELKLDEWEADFAVWCNYKYMNGGPGVTAGAYINRRFHADESRPRLAGWFGNKLSSRFMMKADFEPSHDAEGWMLSEVPILSSAPLRASLAIFAEAGMEKIVAKSKKLTGYLRYLTEQIGDKRVKIITPDGQAGAQLSIYFASDGKEIFNKISAQGVVADWREPNVIRLAPVPLYNSFTDVYKLSEILKSAL